MVRRCRAWLDITALGQNTQSAMSGVACHHRPWAAHTVGNIGRGMTLPPLDSTHGRQRQAWHDINALVQHTRSATSGVACHHRLWASHTVERRRAWHVIIAFGQHTRSNDVGRGMTSYPLHRKHRRTTSSVSCRHRLWAAPTVEQYWVWHAIIALGRQTRPNNV